MKHLAVLLASFGVLTGCASHPSARIAARAEVIASSCSAIATVTVTGLTSALSDACSCTQPDLRAGTRDMAVQHLSRLATQRGATLARIDREVLITDTRTHVESCCTVTDVSIEATLYICPGEIRP